jgi:multidrug efflux pump subunit AcrB
MNFSAWSIRNPVPAILLFVLLTVAGLIGFHQLQVQDLPDVDVPVINVSATLEGAAPAQLETEVARKLEDKIATVGGVDHITTSISDGTVSIAVEFHIDKNSDEALNEVRNAVDTARSDLPSEVDAPVVSKQTKNQRAVLTYSVTSGTLSESELSWLIDNDIGKALLAVPGVGGIDRLGGVTREVQVTLDPAAMAGLGISPDAVSSQLKTVEAEQSGGRGTIAGANQSLRTLATVERPEQIGALMIPVSGNSQKKVRLDQIAKVSDSSAERFAYAAIDGKPVVAFQVMRLKGTGELAVADAVRSAVKQFAAEHPQITLHEAYNSVEPVRDNYHGSMHLLYEGAALAILVVWWFLRDWRATLVSAAALPLSIVPTFAAMAALAYSLNAVTLLALSLVVGILVDDAIVEIENIVRHLRMGKTPLQAALEAADEIGLAVIATTLTLIAVFLPTAFMGGIPGKFFRQFGITASVAVLASLLVARLLTPMMAAYLLKPQVSADQDGALMKRYLGWVAWCQAHRRTTAALATAFFIGSLALAAWLPTGFIPAKDEGQTVVSLELAPGSTLEETRLLSEQANNILYRLPEVRQVFTSIGDASADASSSAVNKATLTVTLSPRQQRARKQSELESEIRQALATLPAARVTVLGAGNGQALELTLAGDDANALNQASSALLSQLRALPGIGNVSSSASIQRPEVHVHPDSARMAEQGVTTTALASTLRVATYGDFSSRLAKLNLPQRQLAIRVRLADSVRNDLDALGQLRVASRAGSVPLSSVADLSLASGPSELKRMDRMRYVTLSVELNGQAMGAVMKQVQQLPAMRQLPAGVKQIATGDAERMGELFSSFGLAMAVGVLCVYAVLVLLFHDFLQPATILAALPLSIGGAFVALLATGYSFSMPSVIGTLMLMGIVTKNSILLVEYAIVARRQGLSRYAALRDSCHKRAQPIMMTTIAMGFGMLPNAFGFGADPSFRAPMAVVVIGGLLTSTVLSLLVIPVVFTYVDDLLQWLRRPRRREGKLAGPALHAQD